jgi:hypothetical protein
VRVRGCMWVYVGVCGCMLIVTCWLSVSCLFVVRVCGCMLVSVDCDRLFFCLLCVYVGVRGCMWVYVGVCGCILIVTCWLSFGCLFVVGVCWCMLIVTCWLSVGCLFVVRLCGCMWGYVGVC